MDTPGTIQRIDRIADLTTRQTLDDLTQFRLALAHDSVQVGDIQASLAQLLEGASCLDSLMLTGVADQ